MLRHLRRHLSPQFLSRSLHSLKIPNTLFTPRLINPTETSSSLPKFSNFLSSRNFSIHSPNSTNPDDKEGFIYDEVKSDSGFHNNSEVLEGIVNSGGDTTITSSSDWYDPFVNTVTSVLDGYHNLTGLPWWIVIATSTLAMRVAILPLLILQLKKLKQFSELFPKLPPPFPPPLSGKSYIKQYLFFRKKKQAIGCPSALWGLATVSVQVPCFLLWMSSIRKMSLDHHPGFDCGGMLWFQNLTETSHGVSGFIFPLLIAGLHYTNVQISFKMASGGKVTGLLSMLAKAYKFYLDVLTVPLCLVGFCVPQGSLVYWLTNSSVTLVQNLFLHHPANREKLGLPNTVTEKSEETTNFSTPEIDFSGTKIERQVSVQNLSPDELLHLSVQFLARGNKKRAIPLLRLALKKDPEYVRALVTLGQALMQENTKTEATEILERAVSKLLYGGHPVRDEDVDLLIQASNWAGILSFRQGKILAAMEHLQRIAQMKEPEDPRGKAHYFEGLVTLASILSNEGRNNEAEKYLRKAVAYNYDAYNKYLQQCLEGSDSFHTNSGIKKNNHEKSSSISALISQEEAT